MLEQKISDECVVIYCPHTVESFEDVVRIILHKLGVVTDAITDGKGVREAIKKIVELLLEERCHLCIIFDEAENIYLATLERIRKMLGQMTEAGVHFHVLFSGRPPFLGNYEQLIICDFKQIEEVHVQLKALSAMETADYLENCIDRLPDEVQKDIFTEEVIEQICVTAKGNFGLVNTLVEESIVTPGDNSSFMVLLDSVAEVKEEDSHFKWSHILTNIKQFIPMISWTGGAVAVIVVLFLAFDSGDEEQRETVMLPKKGSEKQQEIIFVKEGDIRSEPVVKDTVDVFEKEVDREVVIPGEVGEVNKMIAAKTKMQEEIIQPEIEKVEVEDIKETVAEKKVVETVVVLEKQQEAVEQENVIVILRKSALLKKKVGAFEPIKKKKKLMQPGTVVSNISSANMHLTVNQLYERGIAAGKDWENDARDHMYTIQIMALTSKNAEKNLKEMLAQENYRQQATNFFIFKKNDSPTVLLVYYGEYSTIAEARKARKTVPAFLQKHKPYAISIKGAVAKARKYL